MTVAPGCKVDVCVCVSLCVLIRAMSKVKKATLNMAMSFCHSFWNNSDPTGRNFMEVYIREFF